ncbi:putative cyclophilin [Besnoitia besnoiti]|uniref:Peptidyl-prolyl cis-trans isomerase n=1 Tax=Besnoitia besnoiti TaxID=94643 RepID=A0A2A9M878_BESBE|nr:putative cyclophilin [Besnoitia besnoiti]PFH32126.1 putative cyclophilin [Besnoitia besnoiti]
MSITIKTNLGDLKAELYCQQAPKTCKNFLALCASEYYNGTRFHRNIKGFAIQGGDPTGTGKGGESIYGGLFEDEFVSTLKHDRRGILSMANQGKPNTNGSQFFITYSRQPHLNGVYTVFGRLIDGLDTLEKMEKEPVGRKNRPENDIVVEQVIIHANPIAESEQL